jgi:hypothetical protein
MVENRQGWLKVKRNFCASPSREAKTRFSALFYHWRTHSKQKRRCEKFIFFSPSNLVGTRNTIEKLSLMVARKFSAKGLSETKVSQQVQICNASCGEDLAGIGQSV